MCLPSQYSGWGEGPTSDSVRQAGGLWKDSASWYCFTLCSARSWDTYEESESHLGLEPSDYRAQVLFECAFTWWSVPYSTYRENMEEKGREKRHPRRSEGEQWGPWQRSGCLHQIILCSGQGFCTRATVSESKSQGTSRALPVVLGGSCGTRKTQSL